MGWEDRQYYRDRSSSPGARLWSLLSGSVPLFTAFGIRVRAHASLIIVIISVILFDATKGVSLQTRAFSMGMLAVLVILHEFGHCFAARSVGGEANDILLWPLGGLAFAMPPHRPWPTFVTVVGGPLVNLVICILCVLVMALLGGGMVSLSPFNHTAPFQSVNSAGFYVFWLFYVSYVMLLFNLLPIFPLDGGQMLQSILWPKLGYYRSMHTACIVGMTGSVMLGLYGLLNTSILTICIAVSCFIYCRQRLAMLKEMGGEEYFTGNEGMDFSASLRPDAPPRKRRGINRLKMRRLRRQAQQEMAEQLLIDNILAKVSAQGLQSLTWHERRALKRATARQRQREAMELSPGE